jgi:hypothetical protein
MQNDTTGSIQEHLRLRTEHRGVWLRLFDTIAKEPRLSTPC